MGLEPSGTGARLDGKWLPPPHTNTRPGDGSDAPVRGHRSGSHRYTRGIIKGLLMTCLMIHDDCCNRLWAPSGLPHRSLGGARMQTHRMRSHPPYAAADRRAGTTHGRNGRALIKGESLVTDQQASRKAGPSPSTNWKVVRAGEGTAPAGAAAAGGIDLSARSFGRSEWS